jgi:hypothetical protein
MDGAIKRRFEALEKRREDFTDRVRALTPTKQSEKDGKNFSPVEVLAHFALAEKYNLEFLFKDPPRTLTGRTPKPRFVYRKVLKTMQDAKRVGTMPSMVPKTVVNLESAAHSWAAARAELAGFLEQVDDLDDPFCQFNFLFGLGSANDYLSLMEAHMHYHEVLFPKT